MRITKVRIINYRGLEMLETSVPAGGVIVEGTNSEGKTSFLRAVRAALVAQDIKEDAIRQGTDRCEILVDLDGLRVKRTITPSKSTLEVTTPEGDKKKSPAAFLTNLLGSSPIDPLDIYLADKNERRKKILAALPIRTTHEHYVKWLGEDLARAKTNSDPGWNLVVDLGDHNHGLENVAILHKRVFDLRHDANSTVKSKKAALDVAVRELDTASAAIGTVLKGTTVESAQKVSDNARVAVVNLEAQRKRAGEHGTKTQAARDRIAGWRKQAAETRSALPAAHDAAELDTRSARSKAIRARLKELEDEFETLRSEDEGINAELTKMTGDNAVVKSQTEQAVSLEKMAHDLESSLKDAGEVAPSDFDFDEAREALTEADRVLDAARATATLAARRSAIAEDWKALAAAEARAAALTVIVDRLREEAPAQLIAEAKGIPGLGVDGDHITIDGKDIDKVSGKEQMRLAIEIARRANAQSKIIIVDGLERIAVDAREAFVREARRDDYQFIGSCVTGGPLYLHDLDDEAKAAE